MVRAGWGVGRVLLNRALVCLLRMSPSCNRSEIAGVVEVAGGPEVDKLAVARQGPPRAKGGHSQERAALS